MRCQYLTILFVICSSDDVYSQLSIDSNRPNSINTKHVESFLQLYLEKQSEDFCSFTFVSVQKLSERLKLIVMDMYIKSLQWQSTHLRPYKITTSHENIIHFSQAHEKLVITKFTLFCETFVSYLDAPQLPLLSGPKPLSVAYGKVIRKILEFGKPARDRFILLVESSMVSQIISESKELKRIRFAIVHAVDTPWESNAKKLAFKFNRFLEYNYSLNEINLSGKHLRIAAIPLRPWLMVNKDGSPESGLVYYWYKETSQTFNFTYVLNLPKDLKDGTGRRLANGTWIGMLGEILSGRADLASAAGITPERLEGPFEFTEFNFAFSGKFITAHPELVVRWGTLVHPFSPLVWLLVLFSFILIVPIIYCHFKFEKRTDRRENRRNPSRYTDSRNKFELNHNSKSKDKRESHRTFFYASIMIPFTLLIEQDPKIMIPRKIRFLITVWMFYGIILGTGYKEKLFGFMTFPQYASIPQDLLQLATRTDYQILYNYWPSIMYYGWMKNNLSHMSSIFHRFELENNSAQCVIQAAVNPKTICIAYDFDLLPSMAANLTYSVDFNPVFMTSESFFPGYNAMPFPKGSLYVDSWRRIGSMLRDCGLPSYWLQKILKACRQSGQQWLLENGKQNTIQMENETNYEQDVTVTAVVDKLSQFREMHRKKDRPMIVTNFIGLFTLYGSLCVFSMAVLLWERQRYRKRKWQYALDSAKRANHVQISEITFIRVKIAPS